MVACAALLARRDGIAVHLAERFVALHISLDGEDSIAESLRATDFYISFL